MPVAVSSRQLAADQPTVAAAVVRQRLGIRPLAAAPSSPTGNDLLGWAVPARGEALGGRTPDSRLLSLVGVAVVTEA